MKYLYWPLDFGWGLLGKASVDKNGPESIMPNTKTIAASWNSNRREIRQ